MADTRGSFSAGADDQDRLLDEAAALVKEQAYYMKRAIESDNLREALKHASNMICELRTSMLSPKNYYELYMQVFQEMQHLAAFFGDQSRHNKKMMDLYESVQQAGNILPRLYLLATVGQQYIKSKEAPAKEILKDMSELCKGVQHPIRGLFLRYYLSQMVKDKLPDTGSEYEAEGGGTIADAFEFLFANFCESNKLWVRMQNQAAIKDKTRRERERHELRVLVGANLVRLSQLEGMTAEFYAEQALPKILEHILSVKDTMSQQYLFESMIQVFPDEFHIKTLESILAAYTKAQPTVDMKPIMVTLMTRLAKYLSEAKDESGLGDVDIFALFRTHLQAILERALDPAADANISDDQIAAPLEVQAAFLTFTLSLYPDKVHYVDIILGSTVQILQKYFGNDTSRKIQGSGAEKVVDLLSAPLKASSVGLSVIEMEQYPALLGFLNFQTRKEVALQMVEIVVTDNRELTSVEAVNHLFGFISPLIKDEDDSPATENLAQDPTFIAEQHLVCKLVHQIRAEDTDAEFQILSAMRTFFGQGGPQRMVHTLQPVAYAALALVTRIRARESQLQAGDESAAAPVTSAKKAYQFVHKTISALVSAAPEVSLTLWLAAAASADEVSVQLGGESAFELICDEFVKQALINFEEEISEAKKQFKGIHMMVGSLMQLTCLEAEHYDTAATKLTQYSARLLKKPMQCRAISVCASLFWCRAKKDSKKVLECLQKCLKITLAIVESDASHCPLWVEMLDRYVYYYQVGCDEIAVNMIQDLLKLCLEHISYAEAEAAAAKAAKEAKAHLKQSVSILRQLKSSDDPEVAARFAELSLDDLP
mmetsp:Transcript_34059/g.77665  ORF Transcript_34059/g.77665 Transcript_34059/m.77665 type:complete len:826 (+) Transcript_34059:54-2531(+)